MVDFRVRGVDGARRGVDVELDGVVHVYSELDFKAREILRLRGRGSGVSLSLQTICEPFQTRGLPSATKTDVREALGKQVRIELEESVLYVYFGSAGFLGELGVLRVVEVFVLESYQWTRQWDRVYQRVSVGKNEQRLGLGNRQGERFGPNGHQREEEFEARRGRGR